MRAVADVEEAAHELGRHDYACIVVDRDSTGHAVTRSTRRARRLAAETLRRDELIRAVR